MADAIEYLREAIRSGEVAQTTAAQAKLKADAVAAFAAIDERQKSVVGRVANVVHFVRDAMDAEAEGLNALPEPLRTALEALRVEIDVTDNVLKHAGY